MWYKDPQCLLNGTAIIFEDILPDKLSVVNIVDEDGGGILSVWNYYC